MAMSSKDWVTPDICNEDELRQRFIAMMRVNKLEINVAAKEIGCSRVTLLRWLNGGHSNLKTLYRIESVLESQLNKKAPIGQMSLG